MKKYFRHEKYDDDTIDFDFSLLELEESLKFVDGVQTIKLPNEDIKIADGVDALVSGWGNKNIKMNIRMQWNENRIFLY